MSTFLIIGPEPAQSTKPQWDCCRATLRPTWTAIAGLCPESVAALCYPRGNHVTQKFDIDLPVDGHSDGLLVDLQTR